MLQNLVGIVKNLVAASDYKISCHFMRFILCKFVSQIIPTHVCSRDINKENVP